MGGGPGSVLGAQWSVQETPLSGAGVFGSLAEGWRAGLETDFQLGGAEGSWGGNQENVEMGYQNGLSGWRMGVRRKGLIYRSGDRGSASG